MDLQTEGLIEAAAEKLEKALRLGDYDDEGNDLDEPKREAVFNALQEMYDTGVAAATAWTPVSTPPWETFKYYQVTFNDGSVGQDLWTPTGWRQSGVVAWRKLPPPYEGDNLAAQWSVLHTKEEQSEAQP